MSQQLLSVRTLCIGCPIYINTSFAIYWMSDIKRIRGGENRKMGYGCCSETGFQKARSFLTKEERIALLKEYKDSLDKETQGVAERIKELEAN